MSDPRPPSRLEKLRIVEAFLRHQLSQVEKWIADEERRQTEQARGVQARPSAPDWMIEQGIGRGRPPVYVHAGHCDMAPKPPRAKSVTREQAWRALTVDRVDACTHCRPDTALGVLE